MSSVVDKSRDVILGHLGQLLLEDAFEAGQNDHTLARVVVVDHPMCDVSVALLDDCGLFLISYCRWEASESTIPSPGKEQFLGHFFRAQEWPWMRTMLIPWPVLTDSRHRED